MIEDVPVLLLLLATAVTIAFVLVVCGTEE